MASKYGVELFKTETEEIPGEIIYEDEFQIAVKNVREDIEVTVKNEGFVWPEHKNCIANLPNSILKYFKAETVGDTLPLADKYLDKEYKNVVVILLDGMGKAIIEKELKEDGAFRTHLAGIYNSTFLSTTVAATTSVLSGLQPCEHAWLGWDNYYPAVNENVEVFTNCIQGSKEQAADYNIAWTLTPYENVITKIKKTGTDAYLVAPFLDKNLINIQEIFYSIKKLCKKPERKYIYAYWNEPDGLLHKHGSDSDIVKEALTEMESEIERLAGELEDTLIIVTADHGHIDNEIAVIQDYPQIVDCLERLPSLEPRALNLFVRKEKEEFFKNEFNRLFGDKFMLITMKEALDRELFGDKKYHKEFPGMLGNYLAIATDDLSIYFTDEIWQSMHGSLTKEEMQIPLIVFD
ncbi:MAG: alkaline phosphatase family protein [Lachnospiraceae bacterium]|nr:alkaline phosphatase family protein [Lachnospiraceae bacterium]